ncbi:MAG: class I SAM-dependent methyltransferase [Actinomycetota bacterium]|nr:class I SAM-dependent methyltransferase [Actinomycetota bacterium]
MDDDRLQWIYSATSPTELRERYEVWAAEYDSDLDGMQWLAPLAGAQRCHHFAGPDAAVLDAGCGTGLVGTHLRAASVGSLVGFDLSPAMLQQAATRRWSCGGVYDHLVLGSLLEPLPFAAASFDAVVSVGVFTIGHVGPVALRGLTAVVRPGGHVSVTFRDDSVGPLGYEAEAERLQLEGVWRLVERTEAAPLITEGGVGAPMRVWTWQVLG